MSVIRVLGVSSSPIKGGNTDALLQVALKAAEECGSVETEFISLAKKDIRSCLHCNWCLRKQEEGKFCNQRDDMVEIFPRIMAADAYLFASPVYATRLSGYMANFLDRFRCFGHGNYYRHALRNRVGGALAVGWYRNMGGETTLLSIIGGMIAFGIIPISPTLSPGGSEFGVVGLGSEHGTGKFDPNDKLGVLKDEFALAGAHTLGTRLVEVARLLKVGREALKSAAVSS